MRSLKVARPLLATVVYFVVFAMVLFSWVTFAISCLSRLHLVVPRIIGVQSFKGSLRRNCYLLPIQGEGQTHLRNTFCGGHLNVTTLQPSPYLQLDGSSAETVKGYICPLGQICQVLLVFLRVQPYIIPFHRRAKILTMVSRALIQSGILFFRWS